jgi:hypothetical protein
MPTQLFTFGANQELVDALSNSGAHFIVIGGLAVHYHASERQVDDLDLLIEPSVTTAEKVITALSSCPLFKHSITVDQLLQPKRMQIPAKIYFYADILTPGQELDFHEHWGQAHDAKIGNTAVKMASTQMLKLYKKPLDPSSQPSHQTLKG